MKKATVDRKPVLTDAQKAQLASLPVDVVLHPRRTVETMPYTELRAEIAAVFRRVKRAAPPPPAIP